MDHFGAARTYKPSSNIVALMKQVRFLTFEGHLLRPSYLTHASFHFDYSDKSVRHPNNAVKAVLIGERYYKTTAIPHLYKFFRGAIKETEFKTILPRHQAYTNASPSPSPPVSTPRVPRTTNIVTQTSDPLTEVMMKLNAIEAKISQPSKHQRRSKKKRSSTSFIKFVRSSSSEDEIRTGDSSKKEAENENPAPHPSGAEKQPSPSSSVEPDIQCLSDSSCDEQKAKITPYDDTYDRMASAYRRKGLRFLKAMTILMSCDGSRSKAISTYQLRTSAYDIVLTSGYRITESTEVQKAALEKIMDTNFLPKTSLNCIEIYRPAENLIAAGKLTDAQLHHCCMHPLLPDREPVE